MEQINQIRTAVGLPASDSADVSDVLARVTFTTGDADAVLGNVKLPYPDGSLNEVLAKGPKDFLYRYSDIVRDNIVNKPSPTPPPATPETPPTPVETPPSSGQGSEQTTNKSLLQIISEFLGQIIIGRK